MHSSYLVLYYNPLSGAQQINKRCTSTYLVFITTHCQTQSMHSSYLVFYYNPLSGAQQINKRCTSTYLVFITTHCQTQSMQTRDALLIPGVILQPIVRRIANKQEMHLHIPGIYYNPLPGAKHANKRSTSTYLVLYYITTHCQAHSK